MNFSKWMQTASKIWWLKMKWLKTLVSCCLVSLFTPCVLYHIERLRNLQSNRKQNINNRFKLKPLKFNMFRCIFYDDAKESCNATLGHTHALHLFHIFCAINAISFSILYGSKAKLEVILVDRSGTWVCMWCGDASSCIKYSCTFHMHQYLVSCYTSSQYHHSIQ